MSRDLVIEAKREIIRVKSGIHEFQSKIVSLRDPFTFHIQEEILSHVHFEDQLKAYLKYWEKFGQYSVTGNWIIYDEEAKESEWWVEEYVITDIVFPESPDYETIIEDAGLEFLKEDPCPIAYIKEKDYKKLLLDLIKELESEDYICEIVRE